MLLSVNSILILWVSTIGGEAKQCSIPAIERELVVNPKKENYEVGDVLKFSCRPGLTRVGPDSAQCYHFGWSPGVPLCKALVQSCGQPRKLLNGKVKGSIKEEYEHGEVVEYNCNSRFLLKGPNKIQCVDGNWTTMPLCFEEERTCGDVPEIHHGYSQLSYPPYHHGDSVEFTCTDNFIMIGHRSITCVSGRWTELPQCVARDQLENCNPLRFSTNKPNQLGGKKVPHNFQIRYKCKGKADFYYSTCINGTWIPELSCTKVEKKSCPPPPQIPNAQEIKTTVNYQDGEKVSVLCQEKHLTQETEELVCRDGRWQSVPRCVVLHVEKIPCSQPPEIDHGTIMSSPLPEDRKDSTDSRLYDHGTKIDYNCDDGFRLSDEHGTTCHMGKWTSPPQCIKTCSKLDIEIENGFLSESDITYTLNTKTQYKCNPGYVTAAGETSGSIICLQSGWSAQPKCIKSCDIPIFKNAKTKNNGTWFKLNDTLDYECHAGYENKYKRTTDSIVCNYHGWSGVPSCYERLCSIPEIERYLLVNPRKEKYKVGDVLKFSCRSRLIRVGPDSVQCYDFGWSPNIPICKDQVGSCGLPPQLLNGKVKGTTKEEYGHGEVVEYNCNPRFLLKGSHKIQCVDGKWTAMPVCFDEERTCGDIPEIHHGYSQISFPPYRHGDSVEFTCTDNFIMIGHRSITCVSGRWTQIPQCVATDQLEKCKAPRLTTYKPNQPDRNEFPHNFDLSYKCKGKAVFDHSTCINGTWVPEPSCTKVAKKSCPPPPQIPNAKDMRTTVKYWDGEKVSVLCEEKYIAQETEELVCKDGRWQSLPRCVAKCGPPPPIANGDIITFPKPMYLEDSSVEYKCQSLYKLQGNKQIVCRNAQWSEPPKCLSACVISKQIMNKHNIMLKWKTGEKLYAPSGDTVEFSCKVGYSALTSKPFRIACIDGHFDYPTCTKDGAGW